MLRKKKPYFKKHLNPYVNDKKFIIGQKKDIYESQKKLISEQDLKSISNLDSPEEITLEDLTSKDIELMDQLLPQEIEEFPISEKLDEGLYEFIETEIGNNDTMRNLTHLTLTLTHLTHSPTSPSPHLTHSTSSPSLSLTLTLTHPHPSPSPSPSRPH